jgi:hypothetical protein
MIFAYLVVFVLGGLIIPVLLTGNTTTAILAHSIIGGVRFLCTLMRTLFQLARTVLNHPARANAMDLVLTGVTTAFTMIFDTIFYAPSAFRRSILQDPQETTPFIRIDLQATDRAREYFRSHPSRQICPARNADLTLCTRSRAKMTGEEFYFCCELHRRQCTVGL